MLFLFKSSPLNQRYTEPEKSLCTWFGKCCRQVEAEEVSNSRNKIHQTTYKEFFGLGRVELFPMIGMLFRLDTGAVFLFGSHLLVGPLLHSWIESWASTDRRYDLYLYPLPSSQ